MKTKTKVFCSILLLLLLSAHAPAQGLSVLANFTGGDGANPQAGLVGSGSTLYGVAYAGGGSDDGTVFSINTNNGNLAVLYSFYGAEYNIYINSYTTTDGASPAGGLALSGTALYGTTYVGGTSDNGTVFMINTNGSGYLILHSFPGGNGGSNPEGGLLLAGNTLYGTTMLGGTAGQGCVFRINTNGTGFTNIYSFLGGTNGSNPEGNLILSGNTLYGTTYGPYFGQSAGYGTVFRVNTDGTGFSNIYHFTGNTDGAYPEAGLVLSGSTLYGTASAGGHFLGTVFGVNTNGSGFTSTEFNGDNGANPQCSLVLVDGALYGTTPNGGSEGWGTIFQYIPNGGGLNAIYAFTNGNDGAAPEAGLMVMGNSFFGTTQATDNYGYEGTVFALPPPALTGIPLSIVAQGSQVTLTWSSPAFSLQSSTNVAGPYTNVPNATSPYTTAVPGQQRFFRLEGN